MRPPIAIVLFLMLAQFSTGQDATRALEEIVSVRQALLDRELALLEDNRRTSTEVNELRIGLLNAKIDLESEKENIRQVIKLLSEIQGLQKRKLDELRLLYERGTGDFQAVSEQQIKILQTKVRTAKARERANKAEPQG